MQYRWPVMAESGWQVSGSAPSNWERLMVPALCAGAAEDLVTRAGLRPGDRVLDVACGTGIVARRAVDCVRWGGRVTGVDRNPQMLAVAREVTTHVYPPIEWIEADVATLPLEDASFDVAVCQFAVQFFPDRRAAFSEIRRVLGPGGRLAFSVIRGAALHRPWIVLAEALDAHVSKQAGDTVRSIFAVESIDDVRTELQLAGFSGVRIENRFAPARYPSFADFAGFETASMPTPPEVAASIQANFDAIAADVAAALADQEDDHGVVFPLHCWIVDAHR
jgi:ubiquinone/menaquinone biosynthesis C-methylase UbiE